MEETEFRSVFLSDLHLGFKGCQAHRLLDFLLTVRADYLYLLGDIVDFQALRLKWRWKPVHSEVVQAILHLARNGTRVCYVPGNHDQEAHPFLGSIQDLVDIDVALETSHVPCWRRR